MYDPNLHHRKSIRLKGHNYSQPGLYFITMCCHQQQCRFGKVVDGEIQLNEFGLIAMEEWEKLPARYPNTALDVYQIMPNHIHGIVHITDLASSVATAININIDSEVNGLRKPLQACGDMMGAYKSLVFNACLEISKANNQHMGKLWQRNFYEHIIRNEKSYNTIADYIISNPQNWETDKFYTP